MSHMRLKESHEQAFSAGVPSPSNPKWSALREQVRTDWALSGPERKLMECLMDRFERHPEDILILRPILRRAFRADDELVLHDVNEQNNHTDGGND